jgi:LacI family transcriptional regulator
MVKLTITQLADRLGVSVCTVNKALSGKPKVSEATRRRIIEEASRLGYRPSRPAQALARNPIRLAYVHPAHFESFFGPFVKGVHAGVESLRDCRLSMSMHKLDPAKWASVLLSAVRSLVRSGLSGLILSPLAGVDYEPVWEVLAKHRVPLAQLGLETPGSPAVLTVRQDALTSGQIAAELLSHFPGPVAIMIGNRRVADHEEKLRGFQAEAANRGMAIAAVCEHQDDPKLSYTLTRRLFREHPEIRGIYVATDNFSGILRALKQRGTPGRPKVVATGLFPEIRAAMDLDVVHFSLDQRMAEQGELVVHSMHDLLSGIPLKTTKILVPPLVAVRNNIDALASRLPAVSPAA